MEVIRTRLPAILPDGSVWLFICLYPPPLPGQEEGGEMEKEMGEWVQGLV